MTEESADGKRGANHTDQSTRAALLPPIVVYGRGFVDEFVDAPDDKRTPNPAAGYSLVAIPAIRKQAPGTPTKMIRKSARFIGFR